MKKHWTKAEIENRFSFIKRGRLQEWVRRNYIKPAIASRAQGVSARFNRKNIYHILVFHALLSYGISRRKAMAALQDIDIVPKCKYIFIHETNRTKWWQFLDKFPPFREDEHKVFLVVNIGMIKTMVDNLE